MVGRTRIVAVLALLVPLVGRAGAACRSSCREQIAACRRVECGSLRGRERHRCALACGSRSTCTAPGAAIRTLAYVVSECRWDPPGTFSGHQRLVIRRGNCDPVTVMELPLPAVPDPGGNPGGICRNYGDS